MRKKRIRLGVHETTWYSGNDSGDKRVLEHLAHSEVRGNIACRQAIPAQTWSCSAPKTIKLLRPRPLSDRRRNWTKVFAAFSSVDLNTEPEMNPVVPLQQCSDRARSASVQDSRFPHRGDPTLCQNHSGSSSPRLKSAESRLCRAL